MENCTELITSGISKDCDAINGAIGVDKDLILVNYSDFDRGATLDAGNRVSSGDNEGGLTSIKLKAGATQYVFEGTDYSVIPTITAEIKEDGNTWFIHSLAFMSYSKLAKDRNTLKILGNSIVIAIAVDRSTGLYELFGAEQGLRVTAIERTYTGSQNSNFYGVTIATPDIAVIRESSLGELSVSVTTA